MSVAMSQEMYFDRDEQTALITPDALRVRFQQSGFREATLHETADGPDLMLGDKLALLLSVENDFVNGITMDVTFIDKSGERRARLAAELLQSMGWIVEE